MRVIYRLKISITLAVNSNDQRFMRITHSSTKKAKTLIAMVKKLIID